VIHATNVHRIYHLGGQEIRALDGIDLRIGRGEYVRTIGASGSGKSTLLNLLAGLDRATAGHIETPIGDLSVLSGHELAQWRSRHVGMVFQSFNLIAHRTALQNVELALVFTRVSPAECRERATRQLTHLGLADRLHHRPADLSGGEQQRVALARALVKNPELLLADEPTGNLDQENAAQMAQVLAELNHRGMTIVLVTHDPSLAADDAHRTIRMNFGRVTGETIHRSLGPTAGSFGEKFPARDLSPDSAESPESPESPASREPSALPEARESRKPPHSPGAAP
jgi:putative ABC transport system ATP-binding protein